MNGTPQKEHIISIVDPFSYHGSIHKNLILKPMDVKIPLGIGVITPTNVQNIPSKLASEFIKTVQESIRSRHKTFA